MRLPYNPRAYQHTIIEQVLDLPRCAIWAGMGLGKTLSTLTALDILELTEPGPALVLAPPHRWPLVRSHAPGRGAADCNRRQHATSWPTQLCRFGLSYSLYASEIKPP